VIILKNQSKEIIEQANKEEVKMDEGTLECDDQTKSNEQLDLNVNDVSNEQFDLEVDIQHTTNNLSITKKELLKKNPHKSKEYVDYFISYVNASFGKYSSYQIRNSVKRFNTECDKIKGSKSNDQNNRKSMISNMELFLNEIIKFQKDNVETMKRRKIKNRNF